MRLISVFVLLVCFSCTLIAQPIQTTKHIDGLRDKPLKYIAITNLTIIPEPGKKIENGTILIRDNTIEQVGINISIPQGATVKNGRGMWCYAGLVEAYTNAGIGNSKKQDNNPDDEEGPLTPIVTQAKHWNQAVKPQERAVEHCTLDEKTAEEFRKLGFTILHTNSMDGIFRGSSAVLFARGGTNHEITIASDVMQWMSFRKGSSKTPYPSALMGSIALIRQTFLDAQWYASAHAQQSSTRLPEFNVSYEALAKSISGKQSFLFESENEHSLLRAYQIAKEFQLNAIYEGSGYEYRRLSSLVPFKPFLILPLNFPSVPDVSTTERALDVAFDDLKHWDAAPENPMRCDSAGLQFCLTTHGLKNKDEFWKNLRKAVERGLKQDVALASLTTLPAKMLGVSSTCGMIKQGYLANLVLTDGNIFENDAQIRSVFVAGDEYIYSKLPDYDLRGVWSLILENGKRLRLDIDGKMESPSATLKSDTLVLPLQSIFNGSTVSFRFSGDTVGYKGVIRLSGMMDSLQAGGTITYPDGKTAYWSARRDSAYVEKKSDEKSKTKETKQPIRALTVTTPNTAYGTVGLPKQQSVLLKSATVWTCNKIGEVLSETDVLIKNGKIAAIGKNLSGADVTIEAKGKHITPGIIDEHSHIAIEQGVNEGTHAVTAEVRIGDVVFPDDINIYRQLSGGVTSSHLLHGSANPIGGQLQLIKLRWGEDAEGLKFREAMGTIKFALGENVKQANWGDRFSIRYPQTRMGVEEIMRDGFQAAIEYEKRRAESATSNTPFKRDLQLETLLEIIRGKRFIHCHSYVQSEILMLMRLCEDFKFQVKNFTHILEGYKVAREMKEHGTTASSFADWWAYKMEVQDAIPQNPAILAEQGVVTSINSDDAEMARRLNQEAAKSVKYGGMKETDALKMVTINPAIQLGVDDVTGSLEPGKQADVVVWSGHPLSNLSRVEQTYVDGKKYFDLEIDAQLRARDRGIRAELEQRALKALSGGEAKSPAASRSKREYDCEDVGDEVGGNELKD